MTKNKWLLVSALTALTGVSVAAAQPGSCDHDHLAKLDKNADGVVTTAEFEASWLERFTSSDANKDGKVTADELAARFEAHKQERFSKRDANKNGQLDRDEVKKMPAAWFDKIDTDKSGSLSEAELTAAKGAWKSKLGKHGRALPGDTNNDGTITKEEAVAGLTKMSKALDVDGDGKLSKEELKKGRHGRGHGGHGRGFGHERGARGQGSSDAG